MLDIKMEWSIFALVELRIALTDSEGFSMKIPFRNSPLCCTKIREYKE